MKKMFAVLLAALSFSCVDVTLDEPNVCNTTQLGTVYATPANVQMPPQSFSAIVDLSGTFKSLNSMFDQVQITITQLTVSNNTDLAWLKQIDVTIDGGTSDTPTAPLATYKSDGTDPGDTLPIRLEMDSDTLFRYLQNPVTLNFTVNGSPSQSDASFSQTVCMDIKGTLKKSVPQ